MEEARREKERARKMRSEKKWFEGGATAVENENKGRSASRNLGRGALEGGGCEGCGGSFGSIRRLPM